MKQNPIGWCDITINPFVGCSKCSPGCANCYAEKFAARLARNPKTAQKYAGVVDEHGKWTGAVRYFFYWYEKLPKTPKRIFLNSMSDFFHPAVGEDDIHEILDRISDDAKQHTFLLLTKRPVRMAEVLSHRALPPNIWLGVTVCNQEEANTKIPVLLDTPAAKRFVSVEPMLGPVNLTHHFFSEPTGKFRTKNGKRQMECVKPPDGGISWVICGGETGPGPDARPMHPDWARSLRDQCVDAGIPFYFKCWGKWMTLDNIIHPASKRPDRHLLDGREWREFPAQYEV